jgi:hypothetical protein
LYTGRTEVGQRFTNFLKEVASKIDPYYGSRAEEIYRMYRNGTVHEFEPRTLKNNKGELLFWLCYCGERIDNLNIEGMDYKVTHLVVFGNNGKYWLPISTKCLIEDLIEFINVFIQSGPEDERRTFWNRAARKLNKPASFDFKP